MTHRRIRCAGQRGYVLLLTMMLTLLIGGLSVGLMTTTLAQHADVASRASSIRALEACETGIVRATLEILALEDAGNDGIGTVSGTVDHAAFEVVGVRDPVHPDRWVLRARGQHGHAVRRVEAGIRRRGGGAFVESLFALETLTLNGRNDTDSYDSRLGSYASQAVHRDRGTAHARSSGHVGSNGDIVLHGSRVAVRGNAIPGPERAVRMTGAPQVWGDVLPRRAPIVLEPAPRETFEAAMLHNDNGALLGGAGLPGVGKHVDYDPASFTLRANGAATVTLMGGTYFFTEVRFLAGASLHIAGPTTIYVTESFDVGAAGFLNLFGRPQDLRIVAHPYAMAGRAPTACSVRFRGGALAAAVVWAPGADVTITGGSHVFGACVGKRITVSGNSRFHYDESLADLTWWNRASVERLYWRDLDEHDRR